MSDPQPKEGNPKDALGVQKFPLHVVPPRVLAELGVAMLEGSRKYGPYNWRASGARASVYYDAAMRHLMSWWEGEEFDPESGICHVTKAIASLTVLRDAQLRSKMEDDRPPASEERWTATVNAATRQVVSRIPHGWKDLVAGVLAGGPR